MLGGQKLAYKLDLACPIALPSKPKSVTLGWPIASEPSIPADAGALTDEIHALYIAALLLPEDLLPLTHFTADLVAHVKSIPAAEATTSLYKCMTALPDIELKHRKTLLPVLIALADATSSEVIKATRVEEAFAGAGLDDRVMAAVQASIGLRMACRAVQDGDGVIIARKVAEELEQREVLLQVILLLTLLASLPPSISVDIDPEVAPKKKKRRRERRDISPVAAPRVEPSKQPTEALELLFDRIAVWMMVAELDMSNVEVSAQGDGKRTGVAGLVYRFWKHVLQPHFLLALPAQCASFHLKVFNKPIQPTSTKKPRKPQLTRAKPSSDDIPIVPPARSAAGPSRLNEMAAPTQRRASFTQSQSQGPSRSTSRIPSRRSSPSASSQHGGSLAPNGADMRRSTSHTSLDARMRSRSRSMSVDPARQQDADALAEPTRRNSGNTIGTAPALARQPSGKDLFKGRQVGLLRRSASGAMRRTSSEKDKEETQSQSQSQAKGLFGRKTRGPQSQSQSQGPQSQMFGRAPSQTQQSHAQTRKEGESSQRSETLIMATPSKPRFFDPSGRYRTSGSHAQYDHHYGPTPIAEEPRSERPTRVAETPVAPRIAHGLFGAKRKVTPISMVDDVGSGDGDADPFGDLMVPTDDEDDIGERPRWAGVPETPAR